MAKKKTLDLQQYGKTACERSLLFAIAKWLPHAKTEHAGQVWLVKTVTEFQNDGVMFSERQIRRSMAALRDRGVIEIQYRAHPYQAGPSHVWWLRYVAPEVMVEHAITAGGTLPSGQEQPCHPTLNKKNTNIQGQNNDFHFAQPSAAAMTGKKSMQVIAGKQAGVEALEHLLKGEIGMSSDSIKALVSSVPKKDKTLTPTNVLAVFRTEFFNGFGVLPPVSSTKHLGPAKKVVQLLAGESITLHGWESCCNQVFGQWASFLSWAGENLTQKQKAGKPTAEGLATLAPLMVSYWNTQAVGAVTAATAEGSPNASISTHSGLKFS